MKATKNGHIQKSKKGKELCEGVSDQSKAERLMVYMDA